eukprot:scaffold3697_cov55-Phaeocystis_antarctica.AAC.2
MNVPSSPLSQTWRAPGDSWARRAGMGSAAALAPGAPRMLSKPCAPDAAFKALSSSRLTRSRGWLIAPDLLHETSLAVLGPQDGPDQPRQHEGGSTKAWSSAEPLELAP